MLRLRIWLETHKRLVTETMQKIVQGIYADCHRQIDVVQLFQSFGQLDVADLLSAPVKNCQDRGDCPLTQRCQAHLSANASGLEPANDILPWQGRTFKYEADWVQTKHLALKGARSHPSPHLRGLFAYWQEIRHGRDALPSIDQVDPLALNRIGGGKFHILRKTGTGSYRVWRYGNEVTLDGGRNWTGLIVAEHPSRAYALSLQTDYFEAEMLGAPIFAHINANIAGDRRDYDRLILPVLGGSEKILLIGVSF